MLPGRLLDPPIAFNPMRLSLYDSVISSSPPQEERWERMSSVLEPAGPSDRGEEAPSDAHAGAFRRARRTTSTRIAGSEPPCGMAALSFCPGPSQHRTLLAHGFLSRLHPSSAYASLFRSRNAAGGSPQACSIFSASERGLGQPLGRSGGWSRGAEGRTPLPNTSRTRFHPR